MALLVSFSQQTFWSFCVPHFFFRMERNDYCYLLFLPPLFDWHSSKIQFSCLNQTFVMVFTHVACFLNFEIFKKLCIDSALMALMVREVENPSLRSFPCFLCISYTCLDDFFIQSREKQGFTVLDIFFLLSKFIQKRKQQTVQCVTTIFSLLQHTWYYCFIYCREQKRTAWLSIAAISNALKNVMQKYWWAIIVLVQPNVVQPPKPCDPNPCGTNAQCKTQNGAINCVCPSDYVGDPFSSCRPECVLNTDCPRDQSCSRNRCIDPCRGTCGLNADCSVSNHIPICSCKDSYSGDPYDSCRPIPVKSKKSKMMFNHFLCDNLPIILPSTSNVTVGYWKSLRSSSMRSK